MLDDLRHVVAAYERETIDPGERPVGDRVALRGIVRRR